MICFAVLKAVSDCSDQFFAYGAGDGFGDAVDLQLFVYRPYVCSHRVQTDFKIVRRLFVCRTAHQRLQNFLLAFGQRRLSMKKARAAVSGNPSVG